MFIITRICQRDKSVTLWNSFCETAWNCSFHRAACTWLIACGLSPNYTGSICCGFVHFTQLVVQHFHNKSNKWICTLVVHRP